MFDVEDICPSVAHGSRAPVRGVRELLGGRDGERGNADRGLQGTARGTSISVPLGRVIVPPSHV